ncbi:MAG: transporter substrate-binding domain-containing protein [Peptococcaceae bacterium]|nr:transporter substrate-binding domain-containing protein [Peptococcaceae bacterium]
MKRIVVLLLCTLLVLMVACTKTAEENGEDTVVTKSSYTDFAGKNIGVITDTLYYSTTETIGAVPVNYSESSAAVDALRQGNISGYMNALSNVRAMAAELGEDDFEAVAIPADVVSSQIGGISYDQGLVDRFNEFYRALSVDGTLNEMKSRWFTDESVMGAPMPDIANSGENGVMRVATTSDAIPYAYIGSDGYFKGYSIELALRFGAHEGRRVEFADVDFDKIVPFVAGRGASLSLANMVITEDVNPQVLFTNPINNEQHGILTRLTGE